jgi:hypothetical protein
LIKNGIKFTQKLSPSVFSYFVQLRIFLYKLLFNCPFAEFYIKFLYPAEGFLLAGTVVGQSSHGIRSHITLKLRPNVTFGSEMKLIKRAVRTRVKL